MYCICDGSDKKQTVIIGVMQKESALIRTLVYVQGVFPIQHDEMSIEYMKEKHIKNVCITKPQVRS